jgi:hypothetical protein
MMTRLGIIQGINGPIRTEINPKMLKMVLLKMNREQVLAKENQTFHAVNPGTTKPEKDLWERMTKLSEVP